MGITVVGLFDDDERAGDACRRLEAIGLDPTALRVTGGVGDTTGARAADAAQPGLLRRLFAGVFRAGERDLLAERCAEAVRRGLVVLCARAPAIARVDAVADAVEAAGALDFERCLEQWRQAGWQDAPSATGAGDSTPRGRVWLHRGRRVDVSNLEDVPGARAQGLAHTSLRRYSGPERRYSHDEYGGDERRVLH